MFSPRKYLYVFLGLSGAFLPRHGTSLVPSENFGVSFNCSQRDFGSPLLSSPPPTRDVFYMSPRH